jgi:hypothetical protein
VPKTIQIRDVDDEVYEGLTRKAAEAGVTVPELLRRHAAILAGRPSIREWLDRTRRRHAETPTGAVVAVLDEWRGPWPT